MKSKLLILAPYPTIENSKDGMISRVKAIDSLLEDVPRTYLSIALRNFRGEKKYTDGIVEVYHLNLILNFKTIFKLINSHKHIYSHSIYMLSFLWMFISKKKNSLTLDLHGVVPEEEKYFNKNKIRTFYYKFIEFKIFKQLTNAICVTDAMKVHYQNKYNWFKGSFLIYSIIPDNLKLTNTELVNSIKEKSKEKIQIIYSGGTQAWQNIDLMMQVIKNNQSEHNHYTILTGDKKGFSDKIKEYNINSELITLDSRNPSDLWRDYIAADYAFILRDDNVVNKVACPTKLIEYLYYGLVPIVLSDEIGDYKKLGYDYINVKDFSDLIKPSSTNENNISIAKKMIDLNKSIDLYGFLFNS